MTRAGILAALLVLAADQASKAWILYGLRLPELGSIAILPMLNLTMVWNRGVTFGLLGGFGAGGHVLLAGVALAVVAALAVWLRRAERLSVALALGAIRYGAVVDFIHAHAFGWSWYVFNLADAAIVCGVAVLVLDGLLPHRRGAAPGLPGPAPGGNPAPQ